MSDYIYDAVVVAVHDGDTITLDVDLGLDIGIKAMKIRLFGLNAPELVTPAGKVAQAFLAQHLPLGSAVVLETIKDKTEKYGRYLGNVSVGGQKVNDLLISSGNAKPYFGMGPKPV